MVDFKRSSKGCRIVAPNGTIQFTHTNDGDQKVVLQDQTTPILSLPAVQVQSTSTIAVQTVSGAYTATVADASGMTIGEHFRCIDTANNRYYAGTILGILDNTLTLDTPLDFAYADGVEVTSSLINLNVDGSVSPEVFTLRSAVPSIPREVDVTRMLITCIADSAVSLAKFGDLDELTKGIVVRVKKDGIITNLFNYKSNFDIVSTCYDWTPFAATNPTFGTDGFSARTTFAGPSKMGVAIRTGAADNIEIIVQDDLRALARLNFIFQGHLTGDSNLAS